MREDEPKSQVKSFVINGKRLTENSSTQEILNELNEYSRQFMMANPKGRKELEQYF